MPLPRRIHPNPIIDSIVEIRFQPLIDRNAVFGVIYYALREQFPNVETLPVQQLPEQFRTSDPLFAAQPQYRIYNEYFQVQIGSDVLSVSALGEYPGWEAFSTAIKNIFETVASLNIIGEVQRLGLRYISFFEGNILAGKLKLNVVIPGFESERYPITLRVQLPNGQFLNVLHLSNHATVQPSGSNRILIGSFIDIDTSINEEIDGFFQNMNDLINGAHESEKSLFYSLLTDDFLLTLKPEY